MNQEQWTAADQYFSSLLAPADPVLDATLKASDEAGLPAIGVSPMQGTLLQVLALARGARSILEIGTLGGYSTIWLARALPKGGRLITLEADAKHAAVARANITAAGLADVVEVRLGDAVESLSHLAAERRDPFDLIFIDADKPGYPEYLTGSLRLCRRGSLIIADNVVRRGTVADPETNSSDVLGVRRFLEMLAAEPRVIASVVQTVGSKGYDGFAFAVVTAD